MKRFYATVRALLKSNEQSGELALAVLEGRANASKESLVLFEPRATDYDKVLAVLAEGDKRWGGESSRSGKPFAMPAAESVDRRLWYVLLCC